MEEQVIDAQSDAGNTNPNLVSNAIRWGIILGVVSVILTLLIYIVDVTLFANMWLMLVFLALGIALPIYAGIKFRNSGSGFMTFGQGFKYAFIVLVISGLISTVFQVVLYTVIDPGAAEVIVDASMDNTERMLEGFGMEGSQLDEAMDKAREDTIKRFTPGGMALGFIWNLIIFAILSLIIGAVLKRKNPEEQI